MTSKPRDNVIAGACSRQSPALRSLSFSLSVSLFANQVPHDVQLPKPEFANLGDIKDVIHRNLQSKDPLINALLSDVRTFSPTMLLNN